MAAMAVVLGGFATAAGAQTIFDQNFDGGYEGSFENVVLSGWQPDQLCQLRADEWRKPERLLAGNHDSNNLE